MMVHLEEVVVVVVVDAGDKQVDQVEEHFVLVLEHVLERWKQALDWM
jgi:hypothetical protein